MSLVERVMSEAVENLENSAPEKCTTFWNTLPRSSRPTAAPTRAAKKLTTTTASAMPSAIASILPPVRSR